MTAQRLDGKQIAAELRQKIKQVVDKQRGQGGAVPGLAVILLGADPASQVYVRNKRKACEEVGFYSRSYDLETTTTEADLLSLISELNQDERIHGILVQLPLPAHINANNVIAHIDPIKDVDGFHPQNIGLLALRMPHLRPCTPKGVMTMLVKTGINLSGLDAVIVGQSNIVGRPMALELLAAGCTITVCHSRTKDLAAKIGQADIVVAAVGRPEFVLGEWLKQGVIVIDVGINRLDDGRLVGDVAYESAAAKASWITPVPGGVGPMTIATLLENTLLAAGYHLT